MQCISTQRIEQIQTRNVFSQRWQNKKNNCSDFQVTLSKKVWQKDKASENWSSGWIILAEWANGQSKWRHRACDKHCSAEDLNPKRSKVNQQMCYRRKKQNTNENTSSDCFIRRAVSCFKSIYKCLVQLLCIFIVKIGRRNKNALVLCVHMSISKSRAYRSGTKVKHIQLSQLSHAFYCTKEQTKQNHQEQRDELCWSWKRVSRVCCGMEQRTDWKSTKLMRIQLEVRTTHSTLLWRSMRTVVQKLQGSNVCRFGKNIGHWGRSFSNNFCCWADIKHMIVGSSRFKFYWLGSVDGQSVRAWQRTCLFTCLPSAENFLGYQKLFWQTEGYANLNWDRFCIEFWPRLNVPQNSDLRRAKPLMKPIFLDDKK